MKAWIIHNGSLYPKPMQEQVHLLEHSLGKRDISCTVFLNEEMIGSIQGGVLHQPEENPDFVFFWSKDTILAHWLELMGIRVFNSARGIELADNKLLTHLALQKKKLPSPETIPFPQFYPGYEPEPNRVNTILDMVAERLGFPMVIKEAYGSFGMQVRLAENRLELEELYRPLLHRPGLFQRHIGSRTGMDIRVQVVGGKAVAGMKRINHSDFRSNITIGGEASPHEPSPAIKDLAVAATAALRLDFAGVDILLEEDGTPLVCEVNSNAFVGNISRLSGVDVPDLMLRHILSAL